MSTHITLGDFVATKPSAARVLDGFGLDYCCHGRRWGAEFLTVRQMMT